jgi:hypothetical protein
MYEPELPNCTIAELQEEDAIGYEIVMCVIRHTALSMYRSTEMMRKMGLEKCEEAIIDLINTGFAKICHTIVDEDDEEDGILWIGFFNSANGEYEPCATMAGG